jgi:hypothetical protein
MQITITVDEGLPLAVAQEALANAYELGEGYGARVGVGALEIVKQVNTFAKAQDYRPLIGELAPGVMREVIKGALVEALRAEAKKVVKEMAQAGELAPLLKNAMMGG